ncbi:MAG: tetratricopeptide repeat protein [Deltaproteobacteria bacterium]|nr:tetratricopeptide repeat protein [Deltaproteobacteria bacterium]
MMATLLGGTGPKGRLRPWVRKAAFGALVAGVSLTLLYTAFRRWTWMRPPDDDGPSIPTTVEVEPAAHGVRLVSGTSWMERQDGIWRVALRGDARQLGHAHGLLAARITDRFDRHLKQLQAELLPGRWQRWAVGNVVRWRYRHLPEQTPPERLVELAAFSRTVSDAEVYDEEPFQRIFYYHALYDMTQRLEGSPLVGCTAFAAWGKQSTNGHLIVARNFDFEGGRIFDREKAVLAYHPAGRVPFVSVAWPGMMGVVTGVNARRIYVSLNAARTDDPPQPGIPVTFLMREILERAGSIKEALEVVKQHRVMVPEALLIADGKVPDAVVVELSPRKTAVRRAPGGVIGVTNHFLSDEFKPDAANDRLRRYSTSDARLTRLNQLLTRHATRIDPRVAAEILRDRKGAGEQPLPIGHRNAIDALIATHGVVVDLTDLVLWVSRGPRLAGEFVAVDLKRLLGEPNASGGRIENLPADPLLGSADLARHAWVQSQFAHARRLAGAGQRRAAVEQAQRAVSAAPNSPEARKLLGDLLWEVGERARARDQYQEFLRCSPPYRQEVEQVKTRLEE